MHTLLQFLRAVNHIDRTHSGSLYADSQSDGDDEAAEKCRDDGVLRHNNYRTLGLSQAAWHLVMHIWQWFLEVPFFLRFCADKVPDQGTGLNNRIILHCYTLTTPCKITTLDYLFLVSIILILGPKCTVDLLQCNHFAIT